MGRGNGDDLAALADHDHGAMAALEPECFDVGADGLRDPQPVEGQQRDQRMVPGLREAGGHQQAAHLVAVEADGVGLVVDPGPAHVHGRGAPSGPPPRRSEKSVRWCTVDARRWAGSAEFLEVAGEALDVTPAHTEHARRRARRTRWRRHAGPACRPAAGEPGVAAEEAEQRHPLDVGQRWLVPLEQRSWEWTWAAASSQSWPETPTTTQQAPPAGGTSDATPNSTPPADTAMPLRIVLEEVGDGVRLRR